MDQTAARKDTRQLTLVAVAVVSLTLLSFFQFPGHTYLQSDTQIYIPIFEHLWDPSVLAKDLIVERPHVKYTLYDEVSIALRKLTGSGFEEVLKLQQIATRALGIWGLYLAASAFGLSLPASLLCASVVALGATIGGPSVLSFEYEPVPRGFAVALIYLAIGLAATGRIMPAACVGAAAALYHAPTTAPFWIVFATVSWRTWRVFVPLVAAGLILWIASSLQAGPAEPQRFFDSIDPALEAVQRMRASYNWISIWWAAWLPHYVVLSAITLLVGRRVWPVTPPGMRPFVAGLPILGMLSVPFSYLALERAKWALMPQIQPMRALLFVTVIAVLLTTVAACLAVRKRRLWEAIAWFAVAYLVPVNRSVTEVPSLRGALVVAALAVATGVMLRRREWVAVGVSGAAFFAIPGLANVVNFPEFSSPQIDALAHWAHSSTSREAVFLFPKAARDPSPGVFRARALRAVYVDWKGGGQVNYYKELADTWWSRWQAVMAAPYRPRGEPIDYLVYEAKDRDARLHPAFENDRYVVYHKAEFSRLHSSGDAAAAPQRVGGDVRPGVGSAAGSGPAAEP